METCDLPTGPEASPQRCGKTAVAAFVWEPNAGEAERNDAHACAGHVGPMGSILEWNEGRARRWRPVPPAVFEDVMRWMVHGPDEEAPVVPARTHDEDHGSATLRADEFGHIEFQKP